MRKRMASNTANIKRKKAANKRQCIKYLILVMIISVMLAIPIIVYAQETKPSETYYKYYTSVQIESGDTLSGLAAKYNTSPEFSNKDYIKELKSINGLSDDTIHSGCYLTVLYFSTEYK